MPDPESALPANTVEMPSSHAKDFLSPTASMADQNARLYHSRTDPEAMLRYETSALGNVHSPTIELSLDRANGDFNLNNGFAGVPTPSSILTAGRGSVIDAGSGHSGHSVFTVVPRFVPSVCPLDEILHNYLRSKRAVLADGVPMEAVVGPTRPTVKKLRNPKSTDPLHPLESLMSDVLSTYLEVKMPQKMAFFWVMNQTMRVCS
jgi:hypothetical protein